MKKTKWTHFWDMHSGGGSKDKWEHIFIEAPEEEARIIFYNRFGHNPDRVSCTCCGNDYSISESESLEQATGFHRGCRYAYMKSGKEIPQEKGFIIGKGIARGVLAGYIEEPDTKYSWGEKYQTIAQYKKNKDVLIIPESKIKKSERIGEVPEQGYIYV